MILSWLAAIPPIVYALMLALPYIWLAAGHWRADMLPDAALLVLYYTRPSMALYVFVAGLIVVRWTPGLAHELAAMLQLDTFDGWTSRAVLFCLPALTYHTHTGKTTLLHMSSAAARSLPQQPVARTLPATLDEAGQRIAMPGNAVNASLPGNPLPEEARDIIRFQRAVEAAIALIGSGKIGQTEAIEIVFGCKRSGRPDSPYARARAAVQDRLGPVEKFRPLTDDQQQIRQELGL